MTTKAPRPGQWVSVTLPNGRPAMVTTYGTGSDRTVVVRPK